MSDEQTILSDARELRQTLHSCPEVSFEETKTSRTVRAWLRDRGLEPSGEIAGTGFIVELSSKHEGPRRLFRTDLDAIGTDGATHEVNLGARITAEGRADETGTPARHACGHDGHCAMLSAALATLAAHPDRWNGSVAGVFQPAEEVGKGAKLMLEDDRLASQSFDAVYGIHNQPGLALGKVAIASHVAALGSTGLVIRLKGRATHASTPHKGNAAISAMTTFVRELLALPSFVVPFGNSALVTPTYLDAGRRQFGRVPPAAELGVVIRSDSNTCLENLLVEARKHLDGLAQSYGLEAEMERIEPFPVSLNDFGVVTAARETLEAAGVEVEIRKRGQPWSEDFAYFLQKWPGALMLLGAGEDHPSLHSTEYEFPDDLLEAGRVVWTSLAGYKRP